MNKTTQLREGPQAIPVLLVRIWGAAVLETPLGARLLRQLTWNHLLWAAWLTLAGFGLLNYFGAFVDQSSIDQTQLLRRVLLQQ